MAPRLSPASRCRRSSDDSRHFLQGICQGIARALFEPSPGCKIESRAFGRATGTRAIETRKGSPFSSIVVAHVTYLQVN